MDISKIKINHNTGEEDLNHMGGQTALVLSYTDHKGEKHTTDPAYYFGTGWTEILPALFSNFVKYLNTIK